MAGKGDKWRKKFDYRKYWTNIQGISGSKVQDHSISKKKLKGGITRYVYK